MASTPARTTGPAARTVVLVMPQLLAPALVPSAGSPLPSAASASSVSAGSTTGNFIPVPKLLDPKCLEALLGYARLLYAQPHGGKLSVLGGAGNKMHTITSWDPGQQSLEAIIKGFSQWKFLEQEVTVLDLQFSIQEAVQFLIQSPGDKVDDAKSQFKNNLVGNMLETISLPSRGVSDLWKAAQMARARLVVIMAPNRDAGGSVETYHQMVAEALLKTDRRSSTVDCFDLLLLDVSSAEAYSNTCVCMQDSDTGILLSTSFYGLPPACTADLLLDLAYLHLELSAIAVKGIATFASRQHMEDSSSGVSTLLKQESKEASLELCLYSDTDVRLVLFQASTRAIGGCCFTPNGGELRKSRTVFLYKVSRRFPKAQLLALPCATVILALLESPHSRSAVQFWETVSVDEIDAEGHIVLPLSSDRESISVTHLLVWWRERFWLHVLKPRAASDITKGESHSKLEEAGDDNELTRSQGTTLFAPNGLMASIPGKISDMVDHCKRGTPLFAPDGLLASLPGKMSDDMVDRCGQGTRLFSPDSLVAVTTGKISEEKLLNKKHSFEESEESANYCCAPTFMIREKKGTRQLERPARCCATVPETVIGGPDKHSANLTALLAPIR